MKKKLCGKYFFSRLGKSDRKNSKPPIKAAVRKEWPEWADRAYVYAYFGG